MKRVCKKRKIDSSLQTQAFNVYVHEMSIDDKRALIRQLQQDINIEMYKWGEELEKEIEGTKLKFHGNFPDNITLLYKWGKGRYKFSINGVVPSMIIEDRANLEYLAHVYYLKGIRHYFEKEKIPQKVLKGVEMFFKTHPLA